MRSIILTAVVLTFVALATPPSTAKALVEIRLRGHYFAAPATIAVTVAVEPGANNRALIVEADGDAYYRSSAKDLDGENERRLHTLEFRDLPAGRYVLRARVMSKSDVLGTAMGRVVVTGMIDEP